MSPDVPKLGLRARKKAQTRRAIQENAMNLFLAKGYDATTVEEIAAACDVSVMTFYRYFPSKEAVVEQDDYDPIIADHIRRRPPEEPTLVALHAGISEVLRMIDESERELTFERLQMVMTTPALRAHLIDNQRVTQQLFGQALMERGGRKGVSVPFEIDVQAAAYLAVIMVSLGAWVDSGGTEELPDLLDRTTAALFGGLTADLHATGARSGDSGKEQET